MDNLNINQLLNQIKGQTLEQQEDTLAKFQKELRMQETAIEILQEEENTKNEQINMLLAKRQELHIEKRQKLFIQDERKKTLENLKREQEREKEKNKKKSGLIKKNDDGGEDQEESADDDNQPKLNFDKHEIKQTKIKELINKQLNHFMIQKNDRIKDSPNELIGRFEQNENSIKDHISLTSNHQVVGAVQMKVFSAEINKLSSDPSGAADMRKRMYVKTFRISQYTTIEQLRAAACDYWGLIQKDFMLFQILED